MSERRRRGQVRRRARRTKKYRINKPRFIMSILVVLLVLWGSVKAVSATAGAISKAFSGGKNVVVEKVDIPNKANGVKEKEPETLLNKPDSKVAEDTKAATADEKESSVLSSLNNKSKTATLLATGDILYHMGMINPGYDEATGKYDFSDHYTKVKDLVSGADLALANFEGTMAEKLYPLAAYPLFNAPDAVAIALKNAGFDALCTANNHCIDSNADGIASTIDAIHASGLEHFGTKKEPGASLLIKEVNGIKIGLLAYSAFFNGLETVLSDDEAFMISPMEMDTVKADIEGAKAKGCDLVAVYAHWGNEYELKPTQDQMNMAQNMIEWGCDIVLGSHPHVLQRTEVVNFEGKDKFIIYSMGNSISNQRLETIGNKYTETGVILKFFINKTGEDTVIEKVETYPTWVNTYLDDGGIRKFELLNTQDFVEGGALRDTVSQETLDRIIDARTYGLEILKGELE